MARRAPDLSAAIVPLVWVHAFRHIALQLFSHQAAGFPISDAARDQIAYGNLAGMILALGHSLRLAPSLAGSGASGLGSWRRRWWI